MTWVAAYSSPSREIAATTWLCSQGEEVCCPTAKTLVRRRLPRSNAYAVTEVQAPVFPCYIFAKPSSLLYGLIHNPPLKVGRLNVVKAGRVPIEVPDRIIESVIEMYSKDVLIPPEGIRPGSMVRLALAAGIMVEVSSTDRLEKHREVTVWLEMLGLKRESHFPLSLISAA